MRLTVATILLLLMTFQVLYKGIVLSSYFANKAYIAAVLCENKDKPEMHCEGKCYLKKQLQKAESPESDNAGFTLKLEVSPFTAPGSAWRGAIGAVATTAAPRPFLKSNYRYSFYTACFHPPRA
ncbi:hypothetical protein [Pontibacter mangrovi]|uniref:Uncharacterized protein n=1 Tax=Pontibacter mangrovi TaxID=2589816 RepID=A0A501VU24_9BACT|nr:hypothetical protein [Pontibacter mangrovi]TPE41039.1 hypothetical protein FJM65_19530 [Pontibacter mangrovi]